MGFSDSRRDCTRERERRNLVIEVPHFLLHEGEKRESNALVGSGSQRKEKEGGLGLQRNKRGRGASLPVLRGKEKRERRREKGMKGPAVSERRGEKGVTDPNF